MLAGRRRYGAAAPVAPAGCARTGADVVS